MVAAHGAIAYSSDMPGDDVAALWLVVAAVAAAATSLRRGRRSAALRAVGLLCLFGAVLGAMTIRSFRVWGDFWLTTEDLVHAAEATALAAVGAHARTRPAPIIKAA